MNRTRLVLRNLGYFRATNLAVVLGVAIGAAVLTGALVVGDSVRQTLRDRALARIGKVQVAMATGDRLFRDAPWKKLDGVFGGGEATAVLQLRAVATAHGGSQRALDVRVNAVTQRSFQPLFVEPAGAPWPARNEEGVVLNESLARRLDVEEGDPIVLRIDLPGTMPREATLGGGGGRSHTLRIEATRIVGDDSFGALDLTASPRVPYNAFVDRQWLGRALGPPYLTASANLLLVGGETEVTAEEAQAVLRETWSLGFLWIDTTSVRSEFQDELRSNRILLDPPIENALAEVDVPALGISTYLANELRIGERAVPYSLVSALGPVTAGGTGTIEWREALPAAVGDDGIAINSWVAEDLQAKVGDELTLSWWRVGEDDALVEESRIFTVQAIVPVEGLAADRTLMPSLPGIAGAETCTDWDIGLPIDYDRIRDRDEAWWDEHEGTPKAFVTLTAGREMWGSEHYGFLTGVRTGLMDTPRLREQLRDRLDPADFGLVFRDVRGPALAASNPATDFGGLFLGLSFFLLGSAFLLVGLLLALGVAQRGREVGTLLALGFRPSTVRRMLLGEAAVLSAGGAALGATAAPLYAQGILAALGTIWQGAVGGAHLDFHAGAAVVALGAASAFGTAVLAAWAALRRQAREPAVDLLGQSAGIEPMLRQPPLQQPSLRQPVLRKPRLLGFVALGAGLGAVAAVVWGLGASGPERPAAAFAAGALALVALLAACRLALRSRATGARPGFRSLADLAWSNAARRPARSQATIVLLACGAFLVVMVGANRKVAPADPTDRTAGTGGFALFGTSSHALVPDRTDPAAGFRLSAAQPDDVTVVPLRVREGDDASCLNLNRPQEPRLVGVAPTDLADRGAFSFAETIDDDVENPWLLLARADDPDVIPAIGDAASVTWLLHRGLGDTVPYVDEAGRPFEVRIVATLADSILQGELLIDEARFRERFPTETGYRMFLVDAPPDRATEAASTLMQAGEGVGLALETTTARLTAFQAVQNTYLVVFQVLGALGLLLGTAGLAIVVLRNVAERRGELAVLSAIGFPPRRVQRLLLLEHGLLLGAGAGSGAVAALVGLIPLTVQPGGAPPLAPLVVLLIAMVVVGLAGTWLATRLAHRGEEVARLGYAG